MRPSAITRADRERMLAGTLLLIVTALALTACGSLKHVDQDARIDAIGLAAMEEEETQVLTATFP